MFYEKPLTVTEIVEASVYGRGRDSSRARIRRQNAVAKKERIARSQVVFFATAEHAGLLARGRDLLDRKAADPAVFINVGTTVRLLERAEPSWKRPGQVVIKISHGDAVLLGNVLWGLNGFGMGLARIDEIACREPPAGTPFDVLASELIAALEAMDAAGEVRAAAILRKATFASTTVRVHVAPSDAGWLLDVLRVVRAPHRFLAALAPIAAAAERSAS